MGCCNPNLDSIISESYQFSDISDLGFHHGPDQFQKITVSNIEDGLIGEYQFLMKPQLIVKFQLLKMKLLNLIGSRNSDACIFNSQEKPMWFYGEFQSEDQFDINKLKVFLKTITQFHEITIVTSIKYNKMSHLINRC